MDAPHGNTCYSVTWITDVQPEEFGDGCEPDTGTENVMYFPNRGLAIAHAHRVAPLDYWGAVIVCREEWCRDICEYESVGQPEYIDAFAE